MMGNRQCAGAAMCWCGNRGRASWVLVFLVLVGMVVLVMAAAPSWVGSDVNYTTTEGAVYYHNFSDNITGFAGDVEFEISPTDSQRLFWTNASGTFNFSSASVISDWISITNVSTGNLTISALYDNQTGFFKIPIKATNTTGDIAATTEVFEFIINATNDVPEFVTSTFSHNWSSASPTNYTVNFLDEEGHYPLNFTLINVSCEHPDSTGLGNNESCNVFTLTNTSNATAEIGFNYNSSFVGTYIFNLTATEANHSCPHDYCDNSTYNVTRSVSQLVTFEVQSALSINVSNCTGVTLVEDVQFNCTVNVSTVGEIDSIDISTLAFFRTDVSSPDNSSWFYSDTTSSATDFVLTIPISVTPSKSDVGNWTINFSAVDGGPTVAPAQIQLFVNWTEENPSLAVISNLTGANAVYENQSFSLLGYDNDLLILDDSVRDEELDYASNTSWVSVDFVSANEGNNYTTTNVSINFDNVSAAGNLNYSVRINVTDAVGNSDDQVFVIEIMNDSAPEWNAILGEPVNLSLTENDSFSYNVSVNVSDDDGDSLTFYYTNISGTFCSLNASTFNGTTGLINFTPTDCDVGEHNVTIVVGDGKLNSSAKQFNFTVGNVNDVSTIADLSVGGGANILAGENRTLAEGTAYAFSLVVNDDDFLIPSGQRSIFYNESLTVDVIVTNSTDDDVDLFEFSFVEFGLLSNQVTYNVSFTPSGTQVDNFTVVVNITDNSSSSITRTFSLNVTATSDAPNLTAVSNQSLTVHDVLTFTANASDDEDDRNVVNLTYAISNVTVGAPNLTIDNETGVVTFDFDSNESYAGVWEYNLTATDSDSSVDAESVYVYVYGNSTLISPALNFVFNGTESVATVLNFSINHSVANNLTYQFWVDAVNCTYNDSSNCTYRSFALRDTSNSFGNGTFYNWSFTPNYTDETYGLYKNLTVTVYPNTTTLNSTQLANVSTNFSFRLNISHTNHPPYIYNAFSSQSGTYGTTTPINVNLSLNFRDYDYLDTYYVQEVNFTIASDEGVNSQIYAEGTSASNQLPWNGSVGSWYLQLYALTALEESVNITANDSFSNYTADPFTVTFTAPVTVATPTPSGGGSRTKLKHYSLKLLVPQDIVISERNYIDIPFGVQNNGQVDLSGISLGSLVQFNDLFSDDVTISLDDDYIDTLKIGQMENFSMRISANTGRTGKYRATIFGNVTSPKFSDWADFYIEIRKANESEAEQILIFTEKLIADNPECLELTELINRAREAFAIGEYSNSLSLAQEAVEACENSIKKGEQVRFAVEGFVKDNFYYISFATLVIFFVGFVFYVYKRVRFNKSGVDEYV